MKIVNIEFGMKLQRMEILNIKRGMKLQSYGHLFIGNTKWAQISINDVQATFWSLWLFTFIFKLVAYNYGHYGISIT